MPSKRLIDVYVTCPSRTVALRLAEVLVRERLAACVNLWPIVSVYRWQGKMVRGKETALLAKTTVARYARLERRILALHPDRVPCIVSWRIDRGLTSYRRWVAATVRAARG